MKRNNIFLSVWLLSLTLLILISCSDEGPVVPDYSGPEEIVYNVEYHDNTEIISGQKKNALIEYDTTDISWFRFNSAEFGEAPGIGSVIVVEGTAFGKVKDVRNEGSIIVIETESAALTDVIKNGTISWDFMPDLSDMGDYAYVCGKKVRAEILNDGYEYKFVWGTNQYTIWMNPKGKSPEGVPQLEVNITMQNLEAKDGKLCGVYGAKGITTLPRQSAKIEIAEGELNEYSTQNKGMKSELTLEYVAQLSPKGGKFKIDFPNLTLKVPLQSLTAIPVPIPIYITFGLGFYAYINVPSVTASASAKVKLIMDSNAGFEFQGPSVDFTYKVNEKKVGEIQNWTIGDLSISPVPVEIRYDVSIPRVGLQIMNQEAAWIACTARSESKLIVPSLCKAALCQVRLDAGYQLDILGQTLAKDSYNFFELHREIKGPNCP